MPRIHSTGILFLCGRDPIKRAPVPRTVIGPSGEVACNARQDPPVTLASDLELANPPMGQVHVLLVYEDTPLARKAMRARVAWHLAEYGEVKAHAMGDLRKLVEWVDIYGMVPTAEMEAVRATTWDEFVDGAALAAIAEKLDTPEKIDAALAELDAEDESAPEPEPVVSTDPFFADDADVELLAIFAQEPGPLDEDGDEGGDGDDESDDGEPDGDGVPDHDSPDPDDPWA